MFISRIKELRLKKGISQYELGILSKISQTQISNIERNNTSTTLSTLEKLSVALDVCVYETFYFKCNKHRICNNNSKIGLNCYMNIEYEKDNGKNKI